jgi:hypothetical protein
MSTVLFVRLTHDRGLLVLIVFFVFVLILVIVVMVRVARRHDSEGIGHQQAEVFRDARGHIVAPRMRPPRAFSHGHRVAAPPLTIF